MNALMLNGSPRRSGSTSVALQEMVKIFDAELSVKRMNGATGQGVL